MTSHTATRPGPRRARWRAVAGSELVLLIVAAAIAAGIGRVVLDAPPSIDQVAVTNVSEYDVTVQVSSGDRDGWTSLTTVGRRSTRVVVDVLDQGDTWVFRFTAQGRNGGELHVDRSDLEFTDWAVTVPDHVIDHLRAIGTPPPP